MAKINVLYVDDEKELLEHFLLWVSDVKAIKARYSTHLTLLMYRYEGLVGVLHEYTTLDASATFSPTQLQILLKGKDRTWFHHPYL